MHIVSRTVLNGLDPLLNSHGTTLTSLLQAMGLPADILDQQSETLDAQLYTNILEYAATHLNQRFIGVELGELQGSSVMGSLWFLLRNATNINELIDNLIKNFSIFTSASYFSIEENKQGKIVSYNAHSNLSGSNTQAIEAGLTGFSLELRRYISPGWRPAAVYLKAKETSDSTKLIKVFGKNLHFNQKIDGILLTHDELKLPLREGKQLEVHHDKDDIYIQSNSPQTSYVIQTENIINASLAKHKCTLVFVAKCLNIKPRTLQYKLAQNGTTFKAIFQKAQLTIALRYLKYSHLSITEISRRLQFSEVSVFTRFIKNNTGMTPKQLR